LPDHPERQVTLFVDNDRAHQANVVHQLLKKHNYQIRVEWLPPYAPELNLQEDIWQHMRRRVTHNIYFERLDPLLDALDQFYQELQTGPEQVRRLTAKWARLISA
jgi:transposase